MRARSRIGGDVLAALGRENRPVDLDAPAAPTDPDTPLPEDTGRPQPPRCSPDPMAADSGPGETEGTLPLLTSAQAAQLLAVRESWLRRRATARAVPCTFLGKHLRFSHADVLAIAAPAARPVGPPPRTPRAARRRG